MEWRERGAGEGGNCEYRIASMQSLSARLEGEFGGRGLKFEEGGRVEIHEFILPSLSVFLSI